MPRADGTTIAFPTDYFAAIEVKDFDRLGTFYAEDMRFTFVSAPTVTGRGTVIAQI